MAKYVNGEQDLVFPTLGLYVQAGETFEAPDGLSFALATTGKTKTVPTPEPIADPIIETTPIEENK
jgi:hypothetical protein